MKRWTSFAFIALSGLLLLPKAVSAQVILFGGGRRPITPFSGTFGSPGYGPFGTTGYGYPGYGYYSSGYSAFGASPYQVFPGYSGLYGYPPLGSDGAYSTYGSSSLLQPLPYSGTYSYYSNLPAGSVPRMRNVPSGTYPSDYTAGASMNAAGAAPAPSGCLPAVPAAAPPASAGTAPANADVKIRTALYPPGPVNSAQRLRATIQINVPTAAAQLWVEGEPIESFGLARRFVSPPLSEGSYRYQVRVRWSRNGQLFTQTQNVVVRPGDEVTVSFPRQG